MNESEEIQLFIDGLDLIDEEEFAREMVEVFREKIMQKIVFSQIDEEYRRKDCKFLIEFESGIVENPQSEFRRADTL